jgi:hypothetical protein
MVTLMLIWAVHLCCLPAPHAPLLCCAGLSTLRKQTLTMAKRWQLLQSGATIIGARVAE